MKKSMMITALLIAASAVLAGPQTTCPVMKKNKISPKLYVDADEYRIYVCCGACVKAVKADPRKYIQQMQADGIELENAPAK
ncbi:MAG: hypothetical protein AB7E95_05360 [Kiritimatiellales bacterium]